MVGACIEHVATRELAVVIVGTEDVRNANHGRSCTILAGFCSQIVFDADECAVVFEAVGFIRFGEEIAIVNEFEVGLSDRDLIVERADTRRIFVREDAIGERTHIAAASDGARRSVFCEVFDETFLELHADGDGVIGTIDVDRLPRTTFRRADGGIGNRRTILVANERCTTAVCVQYGGVIVASEAMVVVFIVVHDRRILGDVHTFFDLIVGDVVDVVQVGERFNFFGIERFRLFAFGPEVIEIVHRVARGTEVVAQTERMTHFVQRRGAVDLRTDFFVDVFVVVAIFEVLRPEEEFDIGRHTRLGRLRAEAFASHFLLDFASIGAFFRAIERTEQIAWHPLQLA